jgi:hypothetical protein
MMNTKIVLASVCTLFLAVSTQAVADQHLTPYQKSQLEADKAYSDGDFNKAYKKYLRLARKGDTFSQYRLSYMNFQGQGVEVDWNEAFAWAVLASQGNNPELIKYLGGLAREIPEQHHKSAAIKAKHYVDRWGDLAIAEDARRGALQELRQCTGSRLGTRCEEVYSMQMPKFWSVASAATPDGSSLKSGYISASTGNDVGGPVLNTRYYQSVRWGLYDVENYIAENAGNVEIGELEMVDTEAVPADSDN